MKKVLRKRRKHLPPLIFYIFQLCVFICGMKRVGAWGLSSPGDGNSGAPVDKEKTFLFFQIFFKGRGPPFSCCYDRLSGNKKKCQLRSPFCWSTPWFISQLLFRAVLQPPSLATQDPSLFSNLLSLIIWLHYFLRPKNVKILTLFLIYRRLYYRLVPSSGKKNREAAF